MGAEAPLGVTRYATTSIANASIAWRGQLIPPWPSPRSTTNRPPRRLFSGDVATSRTCPADPVLSDSARALSSPCISAASSRSTSVALRPSVSRPLILSSSLSSATFSLDAGVFGTCDTNGRVGVGAVPYESTPSSSRRDRDRDFLDGERGAISKVSPDLGNGARSAVLPDASLVPPRTFCPNPDLSAVRLTRNLFPSAPHGKS